MPSPIYDSLHLQLGRKIFDPVAAAVTNGVKVTSALRTDYLNRANRFIQNQTILIDKSMNLASQFLPGLVKVQSPTWASVGTALASDYVHWISAEHVSGSTHTKLLFRDPSKKVELDSAFNNNDKNCFTILTSKIYAYYLGVQLVAGSGNLYYLASDQLASSGASTDIQIDSLWYDCLVDLAASYFFSDSGNVGFEKANLERVSMVMAMLSR